MESSAKCQRDESTKVINHTSLGYSLVLKGLLNVQSFGIQEVTFFFFFLRLYEQRHIHYHKKGY